MKRLLVLLMSVGLSISTWAQLSALEIITKSEENLRGQSTISEMEIHIVRPTWKRTMAVKSWAKGSEMSMILLLSPARDKGTVFLKRAKEIWNYIPTVERTIKLPPSMMMQSWMGTDFINDDLVRESSLVKDYTHKLRGEKIIRGISCYEIELIPKPEAPVVWGKIVCYISKEDFLQIQVSFFDEDNVLINLLEGFDIKIMDGRMLPTRLRMTPQDKEGQYTEMIYQRIDFNVTIEDGFFTTQNMKRLH